MKENKLSTKGMVCAAHPLATTAGFELLAQGGNAFDAAVTVAAVLNVVEPMMSGLGGYGTILTYQAATGTIKFLNASGRMPKKVDSDAFRWPTPNYQANRRSAKAVSTPGNLSAWLALADSGNLSWEQLLQPAIQFARAGFSIDDRLGRYLVQGFPHFPEHAQKIYGQAGTPLQEGDLLIQADLANSLTLIAENGGDVFYGGPLGKAIHKTIQNLGGFLTRDDLAEHISEWYEPIHINYRGHKIYTAAPPATSFPGLIRLGLMSQADVSALGHNSLDYLHRYAEVTKHAFWCRLTYASDPDIAVPPLGKLLSPAYWAEIDASLNPNKATPFTSMLSAGKSSQNTTHFVVADEWGNIVSATQTIGQAFGSRIMPIGTGIWLNNSLEYATFEPKGNPMDAYPGRHKLSGDMPTIICQNGRPWAALGTPGGHTIAQTIPQIVMNLIDFGMDMQTAIDAARITFVEPDELHVETTLSNEIVSGLQARGHKTIPSETGVGFVHGLTIDYDEGGNLARFQGGFDQRRLAVVA